MKKFLAIVLVVVMVFTVAGCNGGSGASINGKWNVTTMGGQDYSALGVTITFTDTTMVTESTLAAALGSEASQTEEIFIDGNAIYQKDDTAKSSPVNFTISGNTLTLTNPDGSEAMVCTRA